MDYFWPCVGFVWITYIWETYLQWRQRQVYRNSLTVPSEMAGILDQETFDKSRLYQLDKSTYSLVHDLFKQLEFLVIVTVGGFPLAWYLSGLVLGYCGYGQEYEVLQSVLFLLVVEVYGGCTNLPWALYYTFVLEDKHGFNKQTISFFFKDQVKKLLLSCVLNIAIMSCLIAIIKWGGDHFYIYAWFFVLVVSMVLIFVYHDFIAPCFDKYTPLPEGPLRVAIEGLASSLQFPLTKLLVVEGSKRSAHSNAYFYGFWKNKCIVLFDTLVEDGIMEMDTPSFRGGEERGVSDTDGCGNKAKKGCNIAEILGVLAHELGHWSLSHNLKNLVIGEVNLLLTLFLFGHFMNQQDMFASFGFHDSRPILIGLLLFLQLIFLPYNMVFSFLMTQLIRRFEYQADAFAVSLGHSLPLRSALVKLNKDNLSFPIADPLFSAFHHSHPTLLERLRALQESNNGSKKKN